MNDPTLARSRSRSPQRHTLFFAIVLCAAAILRLVNLNFHSLDLDESMSVWLAQRTTGELLSNVLSLGLDPHPPGYYLLLKMWMALFGSGEFSVRLLSALFGIAFVALVYLVGKQLFDPWVGLIAAALATLNPLLVWLSQEVRMYMPVATLALASLYCLIRAVDDDLEASPWGWWVGYGVLALVACYCHLFAALLLPVAAGYVFIRGWHRRALWGVGALIIGAVGLAYMPFAWNAWKAGLVAPDVNVYPMLKFKEQLYELVLAFTARFVRDPPKWLVVPMLVLAAFALAGSWPVVWRAEKQERRFGASLLLLWLLIPLAAFLWITAKRPVFNPKYLVVILPAFWLAIAAGMMRLKRWRTGSISLALIAALVLGGIGWKTVWNVKALREDWRTAADYVTQRATAEDKVFVHLHYAHVPFEYYYEGLAQVVAPLGSRPPPQEDLDELLAPYGGANVLWLVQAQEHNTDPKHIVERWFFDRGPIVTEQYPVGMSIKAYALRYRLGRVPDTAIPTSIGFGQRLRLAGYELDRSQLSPYSDRLHPPSNWIHLTLYWQVDWPLEDKLSVVVEMTDDSGGVWGGKLDQPRNVVNYYRPEQWQPGEIIRDDYDINLNPITPTGMYHIRVGVKTPEQEMFWPVSGAAQQQERAILTDVHIEND
ncbi:MAG: glycosyltransferase family 39 protein [Anaerolineae bacterium]|nr:glycosyltransferase family 39 protein [Anaerolineae bacterium]